VTAPERHDPELARSTCPADGKTGFMSRKAARRAAAVVHGKGGGTGGSRPMRAYECLEVPGLWHLTSQPRREQGYTQRAGGK
jgi:hypothetical protein